MNKKVILDLDTGIDDALALALTIAIPEFELIGVVGSFGNVQMIQGVKNTKKLLRKMNCEDVPVYMGAEKAIDAQETFSPTEGSRRIHAENGVGNVELGMEDETILPNGQQFIIDSCEKFEKDLIIIATGPLTNLAQVVLKDVEALKLIDKIVIMGGALTVEGNITPYAEVNILQDPQGANIFFESGVPIIMVGLDVTLKTLLTKETTNQWRKLNTEIGAIYADMIDYYIDGYLESSPHLKGCALHDPLAVGLAAYPELITNIKEVFLKVDMGGGTRGRTIGDIQKINDINPNVSVVLDINVDKFIELFKGKMQQIFGR